MFAKPKEPKPECLPFWVEGTLSLFAFQALKQAKAPYGYTGKPATMRKLAAKGLVQRIESGAYVVTEAGQDLIEGCFRCPIELLPRTVPEHSGSFVAQFQPSQGAAGVAQAAPTKPLPYTVEPVTGGCDVIRPRFGAGRRLRPVT